MMSRTIACAPSKDCRAASGGLMGSVNHRPDTCAPNKGLLIGMCGKDGK
jgi:hypothetical protein